MTASASVVEAWEAAAEAMCAEVVKRAEVTCRKAADELYEGLLYSVQDYLRENVTLNLAGELERAYGYERDARAALVEISKAAGVDFVDSRDGVERHKERILAALTTPQPAEQDAREAVAWRVKDYADGWILFHHEAPARKSAEARNGALVQPLYAVRSEHLTGEVTDEWADRFCEAVNWEPGGQECKTVEGELRCATFRQIAKGYILSAIATDPHPRLLAALTQAAPDGWVLVPVEPDEAMLTAAWDSMPSGSIDADTRAAWTAMLSASPAPPAQGAGG